MKDVRDTYVFLDGYNRVGDACSGLLCFEHGENETTQSSKHEWVGPPVSIKRYGSNVLRNLLNIDDPQVAPYASPQQKDVRSIHAATIRANNEILCQCDKEMLALDPDRSSLTIGPPVRMATVTRERGFEWVKGFEPT
jgi:hypothetical protein